jgi:hypothetical protein
MKNIYFATPNAAVASNYKAGSSSLARAVIRKYQPETEAMIQNTSGDGQGVAYPKGKGPENTRWQSVVIKFEPEDETTVLLMVRDPLDRFVSACIEEKISDIDSHLDWLESNFERNASVHFWPQSRFTQKGSVSLYKFPEHIEDLAIKAGLDTPLDDIKGEKTSVLKLNKKQRSRVLTLYKEDVKLFKSIVEAGQIHTYK